MGKMIVSRDNDSSLFSLTALGLLFVAFFFLSGCDAVGDISLAKFDERNFQPLLRFLVATSYIIGIWLILSGFYSLKRYGQMRTMMMSQVHITGPLMKLLSGIMLFYLPNAAKAFIFSVWGTTGVMSPQDLPVPDTIADALGPVTLLMRIVGYAAFIRGWILMARLGGESSSQQGGFGKAFMHIFGGVLSINFVGTVNIIRHTFGG